jgi:uncharacterized phage protein (TIGR01671 family)
MRKIGYRAWLKKEERFIYPKLILNDFGSVVEVAYNDIDIFTDELIEHRLLIEDVVLEQDTGLRDKNNKKIYEGDIVDYVNGCICIIQYEVEGARFIHRDISDNFPFGFSGLEEYNGKLFEVIGNIHENTELLNKDQPDEKE